MTDFFCERIVKRSRKAAQCVSCLQPIDIGSTVAYWSGRTDGDFFTARRHKECAEAETDYNHHMVNVMHKEDWCFLHEIDNPDDLEWVLGAHPVAADRLDAPERVMKHRLTHGG